MENALEYLEGQKTFQGGEHLSEFFKQPGGRRVNRKLGMPNRWEGEK